MITIRALLAGPRMTLGIEPIDKSIAIIIHPIVALHRHRQHDLQGNPAAFGNNRRELLFGSRNFTARSGKALHPKRDLPRLKFRAQA
jgi:hypothetical protein